MNRRLAFVLTAAALSACSPPEESAEDLAPSLVVAADVTWWRQQGAPPNDPAEYLRWLRRHPRIQALPDALREQVVADLDRRLTRVSLLEPSVRPFTDPSLFADTAPTWRLSETSAIMSSVALWLPNLTSKNSTGDRAVFEAAGSGSATDPAHYIGVASNIYSAFPTVTKSPALDSGLAGSSPVFSLPGDKVFVVSSAGTVYALKVSDATLLWQFSLPNGAQHAWGSAWLDFGTNNLVVADLAGQVTAIDILTGTQRWSTSIGSPSHGSPLVYSGIVWVGADNGQLFRLDVSTGALLGEATTLCLSSTCTENDQIWGSPYLDAAHNLLTIGVNKRVIQIPVGTSGCSASTSTACSFTAYTIGTSSYTSTAARFYSSVTLDYDSGDYLYAAFNNRLFRAPYSGGITGAFTAATTSDPTGLLRGANSDAGYPRSTPIAYNGQIFLGDGGGNLHRFATGNFTETAVKSFANAGATPSGGLPAIDATPLIDIPGGNVYFTVSNPNSPTGAIVSLPQGFVSDSVTSTSTTHFAVSTSANPTTAGVSFNITVSALDANNNVTPGYTGTIHFTTTDPKGIVPANYTFNGTTGTATFYYGGLLYTAGNQTITVTDTAAASVTGSVVETVRAAATSTLSVTPSVTSPVVGQTFSATVATRDKWGNSTTGYTGTVHFTSTDSTATLPADYAFTAADAGTHTFADGFSLNTLGQQTLTATDTVTATITGSAKVTVVAGAANHLSVVTSQTSTSAGQSFNITVTALDAANNVAPGYTGTIHFATSDARGLVPADFTFDGKLGTATFYYGGLLYTPGAQTITVTDTANASITGSATVTVSPGDTGRIVLTSSAATVPSSLPFTVTATAYDAYGNVTPGYTGTVSFTSTDASATLPASYTFVAGDSGTHAFTDEVTLRSSGNQTITATDTASSFSGSVQVTVAAGATTHLQIFTTPATTTAGKSVHITVRALDAQDNLVTSYTGRVHFSSNDPKGWVPADFTFGGIYGTATFYYGGLFTTPGTKIITVTDVNTPSITGSVTLQVN